MTTQTIAATSPAEASKLTQLRWALSDCLVVAERTLAHVRRVPERLIDVTLQPMIFVLLFSYVFGGAIAVRGGSYHDFLMAGIFVQTMTFAALGTAIGVADDLSKGVIDRFRSLPMARSALLAGRTIADLAAALLGLAVMGASGLVVGWRIHHGPGDAVAACALLILYAYAMSWLGVVLGMVARVPEAVQAIGFMTLFPLTFVANTFVPAQTMPHWLRPFTDWNPISAIVAATRHLLGNERTLVPSSAWPMQHPIAAALLWIAAILAVCFPLATHLYRTTTRT